MGAEGDGEDGGLFPLSFHLLLGVATIARPMKTTRRGFGIAFYADVITVSTFGSQIIGWMNPRYPGSWCVYVCVTGVAVHVISDNTKIQLHFGVTRGIYVKSVEIK